MHKVIKDDGQFCIEKDGKRVGKCFSDKVAAETRRDELDNVSKGSDDAPGNTTHKAFIGLGQQEAGYVVLSATPGQACANCRWFKTYGDQWSSQDACHLIEGYPEAIEATGHCNRWELGERTPAEMTPMPVVIVQPEADEKSAATAEQHRGLMSSMREVVNRWKSALIERVLTDNADVSTGIKIAGNDWLITYTNNFADREGEVFSAKAIDDYVTRVDMGVVDPPEWWVWHVGANTRVGQAEWVARHGHFVIAKGVFDDTPQAQAAKEYYRQHGKDTGISHGFTYPADQYDGVTYHAFNTFEISTMPRDFEANRYTSFEGVKSMKITPEKKAHLEQVFGAEQAAKILSDLDARGKALEAVGVQYKDFVEPTPAAAAPETTPQASEDIKQLILDLIGDSAEFASLLNAGAKARVIDAAALVDIQTRLKTLEGIVAERPRAASTADETAVKQEDIVAEVQQQFAKRDSFWGTMVADAASDEDGG